MGRESTGPAIVTHGGAGGSESWEDARLKAGDAGIGRDMPHVAVRHG